MKKYTLSAIMMASALFIFGQNQNRFSVGIPLSPASTYRTVLEFESYGPKRISYGASIGYNYGIRSIETAYPISSPLPIGVLHNNGICIGALGKLRLTKSLARFQSYLAFDIEYTHARGNLISYSFGGPELPTMEGDGFYLAEDVHYHRIKPRLNMCFRWDFENNFFIEPFLGAAFAMHFEHNLYDKIELIDSYYENEYDHLSGTRSFGILNLQVGVRIGIWKTRGKA
jgi:hypothetical protein